MRSAPLYSLTKFYEPCEGDPSIYSKTRTKASVAKGLVESRALGMFWSRSQGLFIILLLSSLNRVPIDDSFALANHPRCHR